MFKKKKTLVEVTGDAPRHASCLYPSPIQDRVQVTQRWSGQWCRHTVRLLVPCLCSHLKKNNKKKTGYIWGVGRKRATNGLLLWISLLSLNYPSKH